ncbi:MAG: 4-(cytidine 5'-diphospho)-2-C-methyl-D-erythritol kinase, partial [Syntrophales bacterium]|nr:4-(cytidine 5'-diphospho)-2-C-methyl-D-erythritol kinase [Syntrophales bacterium]
MSAVINRKSPAKINLILKVLAKRADGFHEIASLMQRISLSDDMSFAPGGDGIKLRCFGGNIPEGEGNIVYRAAELFMKTTGRPEGIAIGIIKKIPVAAG